MVPATILSTAIFGSRTQPATAGCGPSASAHPASRPFIGPPRRDLARRQGRMRRTTMPDVVPIARGRCDEAAPRSPSAPRRRRAARSRPARRGPAGPRAAGAALAVDGTFGAGGYTRAMLAADPTLHVSGDRPRSRRHRGRRAPGRGLGGRLTLVPGRFGDLDRLRATRGTRRSTPSSSISASPRCRSTRPSAASRSATTAPSTCAWSAPDRSAADLVNESEEADLADIIFHYGEERRSRAVARAIVEARRKRPDRDHRRPWPRSSRAWSGPTRPAASTRRPGPSRACASR